MAVERVFVSGVGVDCLDVATLDRAVEAAVVEQHQVSIFAVNPEKILAAERDAALREILNRSEFLIPDGIGAVLAARLRGGVVPARIPGSELMPRLCARAAGRGWRVFLFGAREEINRAAAERLVERYPGLAVVGRQHGYVEGDDLERLVEQINASGAQLLFVALGSPRQEHWVARYRARLAVHVIQGVGGTFDVIAGAVGRAPPAWIRLNLEWLYRLSRNPARWRRQLPLVGFAARLAREWLVGAAVEQPAPPSGEARRAPPTT